MSVSFLSSIDWSVIVILITQRQCKAGFTIKKLWHWRKHSIVNVGVMLEYIIDFYSSECWPASNQSDCPKFNGRKRLWLVKKGFFLWCSWHLWSTHSTSIILWTRFNTQKFENLWKIMLVVITFRFIWSVVVSILATAWIW